MHTPDGFLAPTITIPAYAAAAPLWVWAARRHFGPNQVEALPAPDRSPFLTAKQIDGTNVQAYDSAMKAHEVNLDGFVSSFAEHVGVAVIGRRVTLANSTLSGSRVADIRSKRRPVLVNTTCERSEKRYGGPTWGVCSND